MDREMKEAIDKTNQAEGPPPTRMRVKNVAKLPMKVWGMLVLDEPVQTCCKMKGVVHSLGVTVNLPKETILIYMIPEGTLRAATQETLELQLNDLKNQAELLADRIEDLKENL